jgi:hypothetical protein
MSQDKWLHKLLKDDEYLIEVKRAEHLQELFTQLQ